MTADNESSICITLGFSISGVSTSSSMICSVTMILKKEGLGSSLLLILESDFYALLLALLVTLWSFLERPTDVDLLLWKLP